ncbi:DUF1631 domain-containing protein [Aromatoleum toluolicum]|uniref:DUF1631 family protein n=1 Tax=Aromatoleum toluolicum TaxID=90060 RepID=A0ABX1NJ96_9RHOO|nr:DUF1631 family protein [Aromatoleum toluolicum]NMF99360.1 DUF1631 domain-containing protein [Aromatoleum toluolicum]
MTEKVAAPLGELVAGCRSQMENDLCELFEELGPLLTQMATARGNTSRDRAESRAAASLKLALPTHWEKVAASLRANLAARAVEATKSGYGLADQENLRLLSAAEESVQLAMREVLDRVTLACRDETKPLERRINYLVLRRAMQPGDKTFNVSALWSCIEAACVEVTTDTGPLILLLQLIGDQMAIEMPQLYRVVNEAMIEADILPSLKRSYRDTIPVDAHEVAEESTRVASALDRLVEARTKETGAREMPKSGTASQELFNSLKTLQAAPVAGTPGTHTNVVRMVRDSGAARDVKPLEAVTLDIVVKLFDLIFSDPNVSDGIKALVARLQTTVLQAAMLNQRFFADRGHPARLFLDSLSVVAVRWGKVVNAEDPFYLKLSELVDKVQSTYDGDMAVFESANAELDAFLSECEERDELQNRALADAVLAREEEMRLRREAQARAQKLADACIARVLVPEAPLEIEEFLRSYWRDVVQSRISQSGEEGAPTAAAIQVATDLLWSVTPKQRAGEQQRQAASLPTLLSEINVGFDEIGSAPTERKAFLDTLLDLQLAAMRAKKPGAAKAAKVVKARPRVAGPTLQVSHATDIGVRVQDISLPVSDSLDGENAPDRADLRRVRQLVRGDWVDFTTAGQTRRERLTWINRSRTLFLFSNSASPCAISITPEALAVRLKNGTAQIVKLDRPIFERAIHGAIKSLDQRP